MKWLVIFLFLGCCLSGYSQSAIEGAACVMPKTEYQYLLPIRSDSAGSIQICITGGLISSSLKNCESEYSLSYVHIKWDSAEATGLITLTDAEQIITDTVTITVPLQGGKVDSLYAEQFIEADSLPATLICLPATGGSCSPAYIYQWQQSENNIDWDDMPDATSQDLAFDSPLAHSAFYRRKVTEQTSTSTQYSSVAVVYINFH